MSGWWKAKLRFQFTGSQDRVVGSNTTNILKIDATTAFSETLGKDIIGITRGRLGYPPCFLLRDVSSVEYELNYKYHYYSAFVQCCTDMYDNTTYRQDELPLVMGVRQPHDSHDLVSNKTTVTKKSRKHRLPTPNKKNLGA